MKLVAKFIFLLFWGIIIILAIDAYFMFQREIELYETDMKKDMYLLGFAMKGLVEDIWQAKGEQFALKMIEGANEEEHRIYIRWVWLDASSNDTYRPMISGKKLKTVVKDQVAFFKGRNKEGKLFLYTYVPIAVDLKRLGAIELSQPLAQLDKFTRSTIIRLSILAGMIGLLSGLVIVLLGFKFVGWPLHHLIKKIRHIGNGDLSEPLYLRGRDEFAELAMALNAMCEQLTEAREKILAETSARIIAMELLRHEDRLRIIGILASEVAHELGTPLNVISGRAGIVAKGNLSVKEIIENANIIKNQIEHMTTIIRQLLDFARRHTSQKILVDVRQITRQSLDLMASLAHKQEVSLYLANKDEPIRAEIDSNQMQQVLTNLIANALQVSPPGSKVEVGIRSEHIRPPAGIGGLVEEYVCIYVKDEGKGILKEDLPRIFEPFYTTKDIGQGTGLGLSIAHGIVREHGGWIAVESKIGKGSYFTVYLPKGGDK